MEEEKTRSALNMELETLLKKPADKKQIQTKSDILG